MAIPETQYTRCGDLNIAYQVVGDGPIDIFLIPNWLTNVEAMWEINDIAESIERLTLFGRVIVYDQRGTSLSDPVPLDSLPTLDDRMDDALAVMDAAGVERAAVIGYVAGGPLAALFAASHPERTQALALVNTYPTLLRTDDYPGIPMDLLEQVMQQSIDAWGKLVSVPAIDESDDRKTREVWARYQRQAASPGTAAVMIRALLRNDVRAALPQIRVPVIVLARNFPGGIGGQHVQNGTWMAERIPDAKFVEISEQGPGPLFVFADKIEEFLTGALETHDIDRVLATVLFSDIVGSTELASSLGDRAYRSLLDRHNSMVRRQLERHRGREVKTLGDGFLATFDGPARAVRCATAIRDAAERLDLHVRIGLHTGEVEFRDEDIGGIAVHIASRVAGMAEAGEVIVSRTVADLVAGSGLQFKDLGVAELKGVPGSWQLLRAIG